jgi:hypothetical protein
LHPGQVEAYKLPGRFKAVRAGRRWGKTDLLKTVAADYMIKGRNVGWFAPDYKISSEAFTELADLIEPIKKSSSEMKGVIRSITGGRADFWTLENERAGRSRKYHMVIIDEAAFTKPNMMSIWEKSIKPTLLDYSGKALVASNTNGINDDNFLYMICHEPKYGFVEYHAPTHQNPYLPKEELDKLILENHPLVYKQEYLAEFVDWSGVQFFSLENLTTEGHPVPWPGGCDVVFATIDTAVKTGREHDGTGVIYWARSKHTGTPLVMLDWDIVQIEGDLLEHWLQNVFRRLEELAGACRARGGSAGAFIEDKQTGMVLLQQARRRNWPAHPIDSKLTAVGKDERAISVSGYVFRNMIKFSGPAYEKVSVHKGATRNHMLKQVLGYRIGVKDQEDDLFDCFTYGIAIGVGDSGGW